MAEPTYDVCGACRGSSTMSGVTCTCGHHFHVGNELLDGPLASAVVLRCPRCDVEIVIGSIAGERAKPLAGMSEDELLDEVCAEVPPDVAKAIRAVAATRRNSDPNYWANVMLREVWRHDHGSYDGWDESARATGVDPAIYGPADA